MALIQHSSILHTDENDLQEYFPACFLLWGGHRTAKKWLRWRLQNWEEAQKSKEQSTKPLMVHKIYSIQRKSSQESLQLMQCEFMSHIYLCSFIPFQTDFCHSLTIQVVLENNVMKKTYFALVLSIISCHNIILYIIIIFFNIILVLQYKVIQSYKMHIFNYIVWHRWQFQNRLQI